MTKDVDTITQISMKEIYSDAAFNCRGHIAPHSVADLMHSIQDVGLQTPILVQPYNDPPYKYRIVMGHRRHLACKMLNKETISASVRNDLDETQAQTLNLIENLERKDLTTMQEARAIEKFALRNIPGRHIANLINRPITWVQLRLKALELPPQIQAEIDADQLTMEQIRQLADMKNADMQFEMVRQIKDANTRGEKFKLKKKRAVAPNPFERRPHDIGEILLMQDVIREAIGNNIGTRCLAWAMGEITAMELYDDVAGIATEQGKTFVKPS